MYVHMILAILIMDSFSEIDIRPLNMVIMKIYLCFNYFSMTNLEKINIFRPEMWGLFHCSIEEPSLINIIIMHSDIHR